MNSEEKVIKHLEMIQGIVNRLGSNSFLLKSWSMAIIATTVVLMTRYEVKTYAFLALVIPILSFWILDGYFLWQERLFRKIYNEVRKQSDTDFSMNIMKHRNEPKCSWPSAIFSVTLNIFYISEILFIFIVGYLVKG